MDEEGEEAKAGMPAIDELVSGYALGRDARARAVGKVSEKGCVRTGVKKSEETYCPALSRPLNSAPPSRSLSSIGQSAALSRQRLRVRVP